MLFVSALVKGLISKSGKSRGFDRYKHHDNFIVDKILQNIEIQRVTTFAIRLVTLLTYVETY